MKNLKNVQVGRIVKFASPPMARHPGVSKSYRQMTARAVVVSQEHNGTVCKFSTGFDFNGDDQIVSGDEIVTEVA